jgi:predicted RNA-binding Zn ribbon-like protein
VAPEERFILLGDAVWLDFVNTARGREPSPPDRLTGPPAWDAWLDALQLPRTTAPFEEVRALRGHLTDLAGALATNQPSPSASVGAINDLLASVPGGQRLVRVAGQWQLTFAPDQPPGVLPTLARMAAETLALPEPTIRVCAGPTCSLFLLDRSPTQYRRWCSLEHCGRGMRIERRRGGAG